MAKLLHDDQFMLLYTLDDYDEPGRISWMAMGPYLSQGDALMQLISMASGSYAHAKIVKIKLPMGVVPDDFEVVTGEVINDRQ